jgi:hypothetical protein
MVSLLTVYLSKDKDGLGFMHVYCALNWVDGENGCTRISRTPNSIVYILIPPEYRNCLWCGSDLREVVRG